jgi:hypothetical protein
VATIAPIRGATAIGATDQWVGGAVVSNPSSSPHDSPVTQAASQPQVLPHTAIWLRTLPYGVVLVLTLIGIAYTSFSKHAITGYWQLLVPVIGIVCVGSGWHRAHDKEARMHLIWTQALHWLAFLAGMNLVLLPGVQNMLNADATGLAILLLLSLGTFVAGVHISSWQVCVLGLVMALGVPAIAWIEESALILVLGLLVLLGVGMTFWWTGSGGWKAAH